MIKSCQALAFAIFAFIVEGNGPLYQPSFCGKAGIQENIVEPAVVSSFLSYFLYKKEAVLPSYNQGVVLEYLDGFLRANKAAPNVPIVRN
jgi:hypothetical protein